ncbi:ATP-binding protein [Sphingomonas sp. KRR8]|uniref:hybrid sensor histidine kinase/response regulator n=1 Tax=Sphingomonas sp. KRR8 TaxID=2942996 RepID=UPI0020221EAE|nr:hybrid sensor histidine kinase/response regulator [Sphingomonas sp. KRR8]URD60783.1 ATP-binding protein [Sphingomonas sp. KRR8]
MAAGAAGSWDWDIREDRLYLDDRMAALIGIDPADAQDGLPTRAFFTAIYPADVNRIRIGVAGILHGAEVFLKTYRIIGADGLLRWVEAHGRCHLDASGLPERFSGILVDVTGRRRVEERLRVAQSAGGIGTFEHVPGHATAQVSEQFCHLLGLNPAVALPVATINRLVRPGSPHFFEPSAHGPDELAYAEIAVTRADDLEVRWLARRGEAIRDVEGGGVRHVGVIYDITESKRVEDALRELNDTLEQRVESEIAERLQIEEALRQAQKMEAVGQLTGGIAHDFNNLLTVILGSVDMALNRLDSTSDERVARALTNARKGAERAAALTQRLLAFSRRQPLAPKQIAVTRLLQGMTDLLARALGETIDLRTVMPADAWTVEVDPNQLENAILNLAVNARDAMGGTGILTVELANVEAGGKLPSGTVLPRDYVVLSVSDDGAGMSEETIGHVFEPFFTTKDVGKGTGLGLSMVYGFVKQSGGDIDIRSTLGAGTTVSIYLPRTAGDALEPREPFAIEDERRRLDETVLIVEDDEDVRQFAVDCLVELGYTVLEANGGASAIALLREHGAAVHLLVTDVVMPGLSGRDLADAAHQLNPDLPVLYVSGYPRDVILKDGRIESGVELLSKPFTHQTFAAKIRELLD